MNQKEILCHVDHTLLAQTATWEEIRQICDDGIRYQTASVCIPPSYVKQAKEYVRDNVAVCTVIGFPNGYMTTAAKEFETKDVGFTLVKPKPAYLGETIPLSGSGDVTNDKEDVEG